MKSYTLKLIDSIVGCKQIFKLQKDNNCFFDDFENEIIREGQYLIELETIFKYINVFANNNTLPQSKFKVLNKDLKSRKIKEFEFKSKHLRIYGIKISDGHIIIMGGYKNSQKKDINKFRSIKEEYLKSIYYGTKRINKKSRI